MNQDTPCIARTASGSSERVLFLWVLALVGVMGGGKGERDWFHLVGWNLGRGGGKSLCRIGGGDGTECAFNFATDKAVDMERTELLGTILALTFLVFSKCMWQR